MRYCFGSFCGVVKIFQWHICFDLAQDAVCLVKVLKRLLLTDQIKIIRAVTGITFR